MRRRLRWELRAWSPLRQLKVQIERKTGRFSVFQWSILLSSEENRKMTPKCQLGVHLTGKSMILESWIESLNFLFFILLMENRIVTNTLYVVFIFFTTPPPKNSRHVHNTLHLPHGNIQPISNKSYLSSLFRPRTITVYNKKCQPSLQDDCWWLADGAKKIENTNRDDPKTLKHWPPMARKTNIMETHNAGARWVSIYLYIYICFWCSEGKGLRMRTV